MNISKTLKKFLHSGDKPRTARETSAILDESRSLLVSRLPSTAVHVQNLTDADIDGILAGGKTGMMERAAAVHREKHFTPSTMKVFTSPNRAKTSAPSTAKPAATAPRPAPAPSKPAVVNRATATATKPATAPSAPAQLTAAEYATPPLVMGLDEFKKLTPADRMRFVKDGGKLA